MKVVYIDTANLSNENKKSNRALDYEKFFLYFKNKYKSDRIIFFTGYLKSKENKYNKLKEVGYEYIFKEVIFSEDSNKIKANCDADICVTGVRNFFEENLKEAILVSSDGDYSVLMKFWISKGVRVKIISPAPPNKCSIFLKRLQIPITYIEQIFDLFKNEKALNVDKTT